MSKRPVLAIWRGLGVLGYVLLSVLLLAAFSSWNRPLWYDEMVYFVLGGLNSTADVLTVIRETTTNVNQGVTGAFMLLDYWSLSILGAHTWALRLPSLLFGIYLMVVAAIFLRGRGVGWWGLCALPVLLMGQQTLMYYAGEARTYMPLAAAVVGVLAYYFTDPARRSNWKIRTLGWSAVLIGVLFHPYFALYWPLVLVFAVIVQHRWRDVVRFANPVLVLVGAGVFLTVALTTWLRGNAPTEDLDPYFWLGDSIARAVPAQLFQAIYVQPLLVVAAFVLVAATALLSVRGIPFVSAVRRMWSRWWPPILLIALAWIAALILVAISLQQGFWIIQRQWIASIALTSVAIIWFWSAALRRVRNVSGETWSRVVMVSVGAVIAGGAIAPALQQWDLLTAWSTQRSSVLLEDVPSQRDLAEALADAAAGSRPELSEDEWVAFANANALRGGPVWPEFGDYYTERDWSTFVLRD